MKTKDFPEDMTGVGDDLEDESLWYKDAILYEVHVRSFYDSNEDGIGDLQGLTEKLDYIKDLGITAIWLLPFYPSPLRDDGYDITDYFDIHPDYGDLKTFRKFLKEAHLREMKVIIELVLNHTSDRHPWFQKARRSKPGSIWRNFYVWNDSPKKYSDARVIFKDFETSNWAWDPVAGSYYWHRFYAHQPDLNFDNLHVQRAIIRMMDLWLRMGVDGIRLDAVPYLFEREGTNCENLPETHKFLKKIREHVDGRFKNRMLLAESNQWPEDAAAYFGNGDECHMAFHFPLMPRMFIALEMEDRFPIIDILGQTPQIPPSCQWALFLRNHDELTLEMVTDEERDYMYRVYARDPRTRINLGIRRRLAPLLGNNRRKIELMFLLLFSLPGTPVVYYGDEIGMGDNYYLGDRKGVRTPMQWKPDINAGFSLANPQELYLPVIIDPQYHYEAVNVATQEKDPSSLLWWIKRAIALRKKFKAFGRGDLKIIFSSNVKVVSFIRNYNEETILIVANLSKFSQQTELDLAEYSGYIPEELLSRNRFHKIEKSSYVITLGSYDFYQFLLVKKVELACVTKESDLPEIDAGQTIWLQNEQVRERLEDLLVNYLQCVGWSNDIRKSQKTQILDAVSLSGGDHPYLLIIKIDYTEGLSDLALMPISFASGKKADDLQEKMPKSLIAKFHLKDEEVVAYHGIYDEELRKNLVHLILHGRKIKNSYGMITFYPRKYSRKPPDIEGLNSEILRFGKNVIYVQFKDKFFLKLYQRLEEAGNHEVEVTRLLTEKDFHHIPPFLGAVEYKCPGVESQIIAMLQGFMPNEVNAWDYTLDEAGRYFERVLSTSKGALLPQSIPRSLFQVNSKDKSSLIGELLGGVHLELIQLLGKRTGEMHLALASSDDPEFSPASFTTFHQKSLYQSMRVSAARAFQSLKDSLAGLPDDVKSEASKVIASENEIQDQLKKVMKRKFTGMRIRVHGDYHLGQLLHTGKDLYIFGFESGPEYPLVNRRLKRSPVVDLASMIMSFNSAAYGALVKHTSTRKEDFSLLEPWEELWFKLVSQVFLSSYLETVKNAKLLPSEEREVEDLLHAFLMDRAIYELRRSLDRPDSIVAAAKGLIYLLSLMKEEQPHTAGE